MLIEQMVATSFEYFLLDEEINLFHSCIYFPLKAKFISSLEVAQTVISYYHAHEAEIELA